MATDQKNDHIITVLLVDDISETREGIKKLLSFEGDLKVIGMASTGREGLAMARELKPDIIVMDINMPDMDGLQATTQIINSAPRTGIIIMSAQDDPRYMRQAMLAGAKAYITKPAPSEELYYTIRTVYRQVSVIPVMHTRFSDHRTDEVIAQQERAGNIVVVYSPQGGAGCTTVAINLASGLMRTGVSVLLVDANLQFGDVGVYLNLQAQSTLLDLVEDVEDLDTDYFENSLVTHNSGLKVLMGPPRPELAEKVGSDPNILFTILSKIRPSYDFIVVDTSLHLDAMNLMLMDLATRIIVISMPTLASTKNVRAVLDLYTQLDYPSEKLTLVLNKVSEDRMLKRLAISTEKIATFLKQPVDMTIPLDEIAMLEAVRKGVPMVASQVDQTKSPTRELLMLADRVFAALMPDAEPPRKRGTGRLG